MRTCDDSRDSPTPLLPGSRYCDLIPDLIPDSRYTTMLREVDSQFDSQCTQKKKKKKKKKRTCCDLISWVLSQCAVYVDPAYVIQKEEKPKKKKKGKKMCCDMISTLIPVCVSMVLSSHSGHSDPAQQHSLTSS